MFGINDSGYAGHELDSYQELKMVGEEVGKETTRPTSLLTRKDLYPYFI